jgi:hypothetical protein
LSYFPNNAETRYLKLAGGTVTGNLVTTGTNTAASFIPTSSTVPTNGVYLPAANNVAISTNGSGRIFVNSAGNVGINASNPESLLHINGDATALRISRGSAIGFAYNTGTAATDPFRVQSNGGPVDLFSAAGQPITFSAGGTEKARFDGLGRLGLGDSAPANKLQVLEALAAIPSLGSGGHAVAVAGSTNYGLALGGLTTGEGYLQAGRWSGAATAYNLLLQPNGGSVGIGTTSPAYQLDLTQDINARNYYFGNSGAVFITQNSANGIFVGGTGLNYTTFTTNSSERARIDSSGRLLVGTSSTSQACTIHAQGNSSAGATGAGILKLARGEASPANGAALGELRFTDSGHTTAANIQAFRDGGTWTSTSSQPTALSFSTTADGASSPTERMRIDNKGSLSLGTPGNTTASPQDVDSRTFFYSDGASSGLYIDSRNSNSFVHVNQTFGDTANRGAIAFYRSESLKGSISVDSSQVYYNTTSDYRLKEKILPLSDALQKVELLKPSVFNFIADPDRTVHGFIAHEVQAVVPECVTGTKDEVDDKGNPVYQGIDQSKLVPLLTAALQEALQKIEALEGRLTAAGL